MAFRISSRRIAGAVFILPLSIAVPPAGANAETLAARTELKGLPTEKTAPPGFPAIGLWMLSRDGSVADWFGELYRGKRLLEPINVIIEDPIATSSAEAVARLLAACEKAGFPHRDGHSSGYSALIGNAVLPQFPPGAKGNFSDALFAFSNDHGRIFGPIEWKGAYIFTGAFSREGVDVVTKVKHPFLSFDRARDAFTQNMTSNGEYRVSDFVSLGNAILVDDAITTGDHDGVAVLLKAIR